MIKRLNDPSSPCLPNSVLGKSGLFEIIPTGLPCSAPDSPKVVQDSFWKFACEVLEGIVGRKEPREIIRTPESGGVSEESRHVGKKGQMGGN